MWCRPPSTVHCLQARAVASGIVDLRIPSNSALSGILVGNGKRDGILPMVNPERNTSFLQSIVDGPRLCQRIHPGCEHTTTYACFTLAGARASPGASQSQHVQRSSDVSRCDRSPPHHNLFQGPELCFKPSQVHGWLALLGMGVLIPAGAAVSSAFRDHDPTWFHLHRALGTLGWASGVAAIGLGLSMRPLVGAVEELHQVIGLAVLVLVCSQVTAILLRPGKVVPSPPISFVLLCCSLTTDDIVEFGSITNACCEINPHATCHSCPLTAMPQVSGITQFINLIRLPSEAPSAWTLRAAF